MGMISNFYDVWDDAFTFFNYTLFDGQLPDVGFTVETRKGARAFFHANQFTMKDNGDKLHKIAMNPDSFDRTDEKSMSTLVHEMVHLWQVVHGLPGRGAYHNAEWASKMLELGLPPQSTTTGSRGTGDRVTHDIEPGGAFGLAFDEWSQRGLSIGWQGKQKDAAQLAAAKSKRKSKTKYTCPGCRDNMWGKPNMYVICGDCGDDFEERV